MALNAQQRANASLIVSLARSRGLNARQAQELVAASIRESGLNRTATNKSSGAAGLFQLLSAGYRQTAAKLGGVYNPRANILAILPSYQRYFRTHPNAAPGAAAAAVEASGKGASWYAQPLSYLRGYNFGGKGASAPPRPGVNTPLYGSVSPSPGLGPDPAAGILQQALLSGGKLDMLDLAQNIQAARAARVPRPVPIPGATPAAKSGAAILGKATGKMIPATELFYDPLGGIKFGKQIGAIGGHSDHVHVAFTNEHALLNALALAQRLGLSVRENPLVDHVDPVHVADSYHYRDFPGKYKGRKVGEAFDASGSASLMRKLYLALSHGIRA